MWPKVWLQVDHTTQPLASALPMPLCHRCLLHVWRRGSEDDGGAEHALQPAIDRIASALQTSIKAQAEEDAVEGETSRARIESTIFLKGNDVDEYTVPESANCIFCPGPGAGVLADEALNVARDLYLRCGARPWTHRSTWGSGICL